MTTRRGAKSSLDGDVARILGADDASIFGPAFFLGQLAGFVRARCPEPGESLPIVEITLHDGSQLEICHVVGLAPRWAALAAYEPGPPSRGRAMRTDLVPYASIMRVTIRASRSEGTHLGFNQAQPPGIIDSRGGDTPEMLLRIAGTPLPARSAPEAGRGSRDGGSPRGPTASGDAKPSRRKGKRPGRGAP